MSRMRSDLRAAQPKRRSPTKFPPVRTGWGNARSPPPPGSAIGGEHNWATDMVVGLQMKTGSPLKDVHTSISPVPREDVVIPEPVKRPSVTNVMFAKQIENLKQQVETLQQQQQGYLDRIAQLEKEIERLKSKNASQQKTIENYKVEVKTKNNRISELEEELKKLEQMKLQESDYEKLIAKLKALLESKDKRIKELEMALETSAQEMELMRKEFQSEKEKMQKEFEAKLEEATTNYKKELLSKDEKMKVLKMHMADALKDNSRERQQQLEELTRELRRVTDETDTLRTKIQSVKPSQQVYCQNCPTLEKQLQSKIIQIRDKDVALVELQRLCSKMEKQLVQQDELLRQWARSKGKDIR